MPRRIESPWGAPFAISRDQLPKTLNTRVWKPSDPDWEDRPKDPMLCGDVPRPPMQETLLEPLELRDIE